MKSHLLKLYVAWCIGLLGCAHVHAQQPEPAATKVNLLALADWGMANADRAVAAGMKKIVSKGDLIYDGVVCGGDNIYLKLSGVDDPKWRTVFEDMYDPKVLNFPFFIAPGNHDYQDNKLPIQLAYAKANPKSRWKFPAPYYRLDLPVGAQKPLVTVLMLDSCKNQMTPEAWDTEMKWIDEQLKRPHATWLMAVAHHPIISNGDHGDTGPLKALWADTFKNAKMDLYLCGHDHDMQHLEVKDWPMSFVLVGGGGAKNRPMRADQRGPFSKSIHGFGQVEFTMDLMTVKLLDSGGEVVHAFTRDRQGKVAILEQTPSDKATPRSPKSINRPDATTNPDDKD